MAKTVRPGLRLLDRLILLVAWIATCGVVYLMGFYLGRGTQERHPHLEERVVRLPVTSAPPAEGERPKTAGDLTFYEQLLSGGRAGGDSGSPAAGAAGTPTVKSAPLANVPQPAPPAPAAPASPRVANAPVPASPSPPGGAPGAAPNLGVPAPPPTAARPAGAAAPPAAPAPVIATRPPAPSAVTPSPAVVERQAAPPTWPAPAKPMPVAPAIATVAPAPPPPRTSGGWTVEANPTRDRDEAEALQKRLRARGYDSTLVHVLRDGETWYRLHVGRYGTAEQASEMMRRLRDSEGVAHVFVATE